jgi:hypothetical protein
MYRWRCGSGFSEPGHLEPWPSYYIRRGTTPSYTHTTLGLLTPLYLPSSSFFLLSSFFRIGLEVGVVVEKVELQGELGSLENLVRIKVYLLPSCSSN